MDKSDAKSDTSSVINMKEYAASEYPASEPPPAYMKPRSNGLRIARLAAFTVIASSIILGAFILSAAWIQANTARNLDLTLNQELLDDLHPSYEHLVANEVLPEQQNNAVGQEAAAVAANDAKLAKDKDTIADETAKQEDDSDKMQNLAADVNASQEEKQSLDLDEIANMLMQRNLRGNVNCIVEKRRNEELVDHAPRALNLPFGLNITTPPRLQHLTGEQMVIICKDDEEEQQRETKESEDPLQSLIFQAPQQIANQVQQVPQIIPLSQILQHLPQQQQVFIPQQSQHQQVFMPQQQQHVFLPQQIFYPPQQMFHSPQQQQQQQPPVFVPQQPQRIREVPMSREGIPMNHVQHFRVPINPLAVNDVPVNQMPLTHMPMRANPPEFIDESMPVHHLVPPRPQEVQSENFQNVEEQQQQQQQPRFPGPMYPHRFNPQPPQQGPTLQQLQMARARVLPLEMREPRVMRGPTFDNEAVRPFPAPPARRIRFPESSDDEDNDSDEEVTLTKIIPIRMVKEDDRSDEDEENGLNEKRPFPIPINAILNMILGSIRPLAARDGAMPIPIDIKIERIEKPLDTNTGRPIIASEEPEADDDKDEKEDISAQQDEQQEENKEKQIPANMQQVEIVDKATDDARPLPIPADAQDPQIFRIDDKTDSGNNNWAERAFLPNGQGRGARVFPIPQTQIFPVPETRQARVMNLPTEGEVNLFPVPINAGNAAQPQAFTVDDTARSVRLFPVHDSVQVADGDTNKEQAQVQGDAAPAADASRPHYVQPRSV